MRPKQQTLVDDQIITTGIIDVFLLSLLESKNTGFAGESGEDGPLPRSACPAESNFATTATWNCACDRRNLRLCESDSIDCRNFSLRVGESTNKWCEHNAGICVISSEFWESASSRAK